MPTTATASSPMPPVFPIPGRSTMRIAGDTLRSIWQATYPAPTARRYWCKGFTKKDSHMLQAKRVGPPKVEPVTMGNVRYEVIHWGRKRGLGQNGGYIAAVNAKSGAELWILKVYDIQYEDKLETDVQDIFIQTMKKSKTKNALDITDEKGRKYKVDVATRKVSAE